MTPGLIRVVLVDFGSTNTTPDERARVAAALTKQAMQHFGLPPPYGWGMPATVRAASGVHDVQPDEWVIGLLQHPDQAGALGYHDVTPHGNPFAKVFPLLDAEDGSPWSQTISHELGEMLPDAMCDDAKMGADGRFWATEICDAVEQDGYEIDGVMLSNFILPPWFGAAQLAGKKLDWMGLCKRPLEIRPGGYSQWFDPQNGWQQVVSEQRRPRAYRLAAMHGADPVVEVAVGRMRLCGRGARRQAAFLASRVPPASIPPAPFPPAQSAPPAAES